MKRVAMTLAAVLLLAAPACKQEVTYVIVVSDAGPTSASVDATASDAAPDVSTTTDGDVRDGGAADGDTGAAADGGAADGGAPDGDTDAGEAADGAADAQSCSSIADCPSLPGACVLATCEGGMCGTRFALAGIACKSPSGGQKCDGAGQCVECMATADCAAGAACVKSNCIWACVDAVKDGAETDVDCGGGACAPCANGKACGEGADCASSTCDPGSHVCTDASCSDQKQDGSETDVDCGGAGCAPCPNGFMCKGASDCISKTCDGLLLRCAASACTDHVQDGGETDIDCGGGACPACADLEHCLVDADCTSGNCDAQRDMCLPVTCTNGVKDGTETDVDCGGVCAACGYAKHCNISPDCLSTACDGIMSICIYDSCIDHRMDNLESDVDCGGEICGPCVVGKKCNTGRDCAPGHFCNAGHFCQ
jgi:hypothetical protein